MKKIIMRPKENFKKFVGELIDRKIKWNLKELIESYAVKKIK
jgi:hypothetical protein